MRDDQGGPAFPVAPFTQPNGEFDWGAPGMTLRDYFAGKALPACIQMCANDPRLSNMTHAQYFAYKAYECADAMLAARTAGRDEREPQ